MAKIKVPQDVLDGLEFVRDSGKTNMFDYNVVMQIAYYNNYFDTVAWLEENKKFYVEGIFNGFEAE